MRKKYTSITLTKQKTATNENIFKIA